MSFDSDADAHRFYNEYASIIGFSIQKVANYHCQKKDAHNNKMTRFTMKCKRSGKPRNRTKPTPAGAKRRKYKGDKNAPTVLENTTDIRRNYTIKMGCQSQMVVTWKFELEQWVVNRLIIQHNHELHPPGEVRFLKSHKYITAQEKVLIMTSKRVNIPTRKIMAIMSFFRGKGLSSLPYTAKQISNMCTKLRRENGLNDIMQLVSFFEQNDTSPTYL